MHLEVHRTTVTFVAKFSPFFPVWASNSTSTNFCFWESNFFGAYFQEKMCKNLCTVDCDVWSLHICVVHLYYVFFPNNVFQTYSPRFVSQIQERRKFIQKRRLERGQRENAKILVRNSLLEKLWKKKKQYSFYRSISFKNLPLYIVIEIVFRILTYTTIHCRLK